MQRMAIITRSRKCTKYSLYTIFRFLQESISEFEMADNDEIGGY